MTKEIRYAESRQLYFRGADIVSSNEVVHKVNHFDDLVAALRLAEHIARNPDVMASTADLVQIRNTLKSATGE